MAEPGERPPGRTPDQIAIDVAVRLGILALFAYVGLSILAPFLPLLLWSMILTIAFWPLFSWLRDRLGGRGWLASLILTTFALGIVIGPATVLLTSLVHSLEILAHRLGGEALEVPALPPRIAAMQVFGQSFGDFWSEASSNLESILVRYGHAFVGPGEWLLDMIAGLAGSVLVILSAVVISGFFYVPAPRIAHAFGLLVERVIGHHRGPEFVALAAATVRNVARGVIGVAIVQALLIGFGLIVGDVPAAGLLTLAVLILAILQIGAGPVVVPVLVWAWFSRETMPALLLTLYLLPAMVSDMFLKPLFMGKGLETPLLVILAGVIGGTVAYGLIGLFIGPIVLAVFYELVVFWVREPEVQAPGGIE